MALPRFAMLEDRGFVAVGGSDARAFLQGLVSNDVDKVTPEHAIHAAFLTAQGKYLHDFFIVALEDRLLLDCEAARLDDLKRRLSIYKLRAKATLEAVSEHYAAAAIFGTDALAALQLPAEPGACRRLAGGVVCVDPRLAAAGARAILPRGSSTTVLADLGLGEAGREEYDRLRIGLGLPDGSRDMVVEKDILLENGFEELNGVDFAKGCYVGQELTARTKHRGLIKKRLMPVIIDGPAPPAGTAVLLGDREAGEMRSSTDGIGLALMRLEFLERAGHDATFTAGEARITPRKPEWAAF